MRDKLQLSQHILEGLTTEKYDWILTDATKLSAKLKDPGWRVLENPEYEQQSAAFRATVDALVKAARDRNLDAATLAYVRMTMSCVECHKFVRGKGVGSLQDPLTKTPAIATANGDLQPSILNF